MSTTVGFPRLSAARWAYPLVAALIASALALALRTPAGAPGRAHWVMVPVRDAQGRPVRGARNELISTNWSGYALNGLQTGRRYASAAGTWVVPAATAVPGFSTSYSSDWVGIGGVSDSTLIQLGTESDATPSGGSYFAWYEGLPLPSIPTSLAVHPGDKIQAGLSLIGRNAFGQVWLLWMKNQTTAALWSKVVAYNSSLLSAEWIAEAPFSGGVLPLANFGTVTFDPGTANNANPHLSLSDAILMENGHGMSSNPSAPDADTDGFSACWGPTSAPTPCAAPGS